MCSSVVPAVPWITSVELPQMAAARCSLSQLLPGGDDVESGRGEDRVGIRGLGALGYDARPEYNKTTASKCRKVGMDILSCTPEKLAESMGRIIRG